MRKKVDFEKNSIHVDNNEKKTDFFIINSLVSLSSLTGKIKHEETVDKIILNSDNSDIIRRFFQSKENWEKITHFVIKASCFSLIPYKDNLLSLIKNGLLYLAIHVDLIEDPRIFIEDIDHYSDLRHLEITAKQYKEAFSHSSNEKPYSEVQLEIDRKCKEIVQLNQEVNQFLSDSLPRYEKQLEQLTLSADVDLKNLNKEQLRFIIDLSQQQGYFNQLAKFSIDLSQNPSFQKVRRLADEWDIRRVVSNNKIDQFNAIIPLLSDFDVNQRFTCFGGAFVRLIDLAVRNQAIEMVERLHLLGADLTCAANINPLLEQKCQLHFSFYNLDNFPFGVVIQRYNSPLNTLFLSNEVALYDALAWFIYGNEEYEFERLVKDRKVDFNKPLQRGTFAGFTLLQLMIYYRRTALYLHWLAELPLQTRIQLSNELYPDHPKFAYAEWSILSVVIYEGDSDTLEELLSKGCNFEALTLKNNVSSDPMALLLYGAREAAQNERKLENYKKCLGYLIRNSFVKSDWQEYILEDSNSGNELPLLHFAIFYRLLSVIQDDIDKTPEQLQKKAFLKIPVLGMEMVKAEITPLELAAISIEEDTNGEIATLFDWYDNHNLLASFSQPISFLQNLNLFQYSILHGSDTLFKKWIEWPHCPVNLPFPETHRDYGGWLPIHVVLLNAFIYGGSYLLALLERSDIEIIVQFPEKGRPHYLAGYYPLSALFFSGNPIKNNGMPIKKPLRCFSSFLPLLDALTFTGVKKNILNQALFWALVHHGRRNYFDDDHSEQIKILVESGANLYQSYGTEGNLLVDIAREKGLLHLFPGYLEDRFQSLSQQMILSTGNRRESELQCFSDHRLEINEEYYAVVSLLRNKKCNLLEQQHVFIVIERIIKGRSVIHFIDFVQNAKKPGKGKVREKQYQGKLTDTLLLRCDLPLMQIDRIDDLICLPPWQISNEACQELLEAVESDKLKTIDYIASGERSLFAWSSSKKGHSCYTWAREKLFATEDVFIKLALRPTFDEWLGALPSFKVKNKSLTKRTPWYKNQYILFGAVTATAVAAYVCQNYRDDILSENSFFNQKL